MMGDSAGKGIRNTNKCESNSQIAAPTSHGIDLDLDLGDDLSDGQYSGTFRWKKSKKLSSLPLVSVNNTIYDLHYLKWMQYFKSRAHLAFISDSFSKPQSLNALEKDLISFVHNDLALIDCLSTPVTIAYLMEKIGLGIFRQNKIVGEINLKLSIICIGCAEKTEERILKETTCWEELTSLYLRNVQSVDIWLVGPEISKTEEFVPHIASANQSVQSRRKKGADVEVGVAYHLFKGNASDFFRSYPRYLAKNQGTIVVGINCGFGNFENPEKKRYDLLKSWFPDLQFLTWTSLPLLFTCANDYADLLGETAIMRHILGARFILPPQENPFSFASTMVPPQSSSSSTDLWNSSVSSTLDGVFFCNNGS